MAVWDDAYVDERRGVLHGEPCESFLESGPSFDELTRAWLDKTPVIFGFRDQNRKDEIVERQVVVFQINLDRRQLTNIEITGIVYLGEAGAIGYNFSATYNFRRRKGGALWAKKTVSVREITGTFKGENYGNSNQFLE